MEFEIQKFAEGEGDTTAAEAPAVETPAETVPEGGDDIQAKIDAAVAKTMAKIDAEYKKRELAAKQEAERLSKLSDDERAKAELEATRNELALKEAELRRKEIELEMTKVLEKRGIPIEFMDYFITDTNEETLERITLFEKKFKKAVEDGVNERLKGKAPQAGNKTLTVSNSTDKNAFIAAMKTQQINR